MVDALGYPFRSSVTGRTLTAFCSSSRLWPTPPRRAFLAAALVIALAAGTFLLPRFPLTPRNIVGQLGFQLLLSGPSEELIFRAFAITMLALMIRGALFRGQRGVSGRIRAVFGKELTYANIIAACFECPA